MKNLFNFIFAISILFLGSCTFNGQDGAPGPRGPQGPPGEDGQDGGVFEAIAYEFPPISFNATNNYGVTLLFDESDLPYIYESDKALVFLLDGQDDRGYDIWSPLPQTRFNELGTYIYNYDFTMVDVFVYLDANFNRDLFIAEETDNKIFRVIIVPAMSTQRTSDQINYNDYYSVTQYYGIADEDIKKM